jgi:integrase
MAGEIYLHAFDRFTLDMNENAVGITRELSDVWCKKRENESAPNHYERCSCLCQFASFLCQLGIKSYIPAVPKYRKTNFLPHIYTKSEMQAIFEACDGLRSKSREKKSIIMSFPALIRFLYGTGVRISEALSLKYMDINLKDNYFVLRDTKNGKERVLPFSDSLSSVLAEYDSCRKKLPLKLTANDCFFISLNGNPITANAVYLRFREILNIVGIPYIGKNHGPRIHDLRHTFAVHSLATMAYNGIDLYCTLPVLSNYLGHQSLEATNRYVRLTSEIYPDLLKNIDSLYLNVFPELPQI